jgi:predicted N-formylglutamate amidohydrolase
MDGHRAWDPGALELAKAFARAFRAPLHVGTVTRLLVDLNRSLGHRALFSELTRELDTEERARLVARYYRPHRRAVESAVRRAIARHGRVLHLSVHSFTPVLAGKRRDVDIGILCDPAREREQALARAWQIAIAAASPELRVRRNQPYRGTSDGFTTALRRVHSAREYLGWELEISQGLLVRRARVPRELEGILLESLREVLELERTIGARRA